MNEHKPFLNLLEESFPGLKANISRCETLGFQWTSKPFLKGINEEILSHVGFLEYPILIEGRECKAAALHAICTRATHRGQGFASELIQEALKWAKDRYEFVMLFTEIPGFYEKLAFRSIQEYRFHLPCRHLNGSQSTQPVVSPKDDALFLRTFHERAPLSNLLWIKDTGTIAAFNTLFATYPTYWSLHYSPSINGMISYEIKDKTLHLYDVIASRIPSLDLILDQIPAAIEGIYFYFSPDLLTNAAVAEPYLYDHGQLMVYGDWPEVKPFMIQPLGRC
nr:Acetyltransferase (GNAT) domain protein [uncultured bacterium]